MPESKQEVTKLSPLLKMAENLTGALKKRFYYKML